MSLTVRLNTALETALDRHCAEHGVTKSLVVQESLAAYLVERAPADPAKRGRAAAPAKSRNFLAFEAAGFVGTGEVGGRSADKAAVRERAIQRLGRPPAR